MSDTYRIAVSTYSMDHKIPPGDAFWHTFNGSFANRSLTTEDLAESVYTGFPFTTWHKDKWRHSKNFECGQHLGLDFDTKDEHSTLASLVADKFIAKHAAMLYTTISHTPEAPRARAVFVLDTPIYQASNYALAASALLWLFGTADPQCKDSVRFWYGAPGCDICYLGNVLPLETVKHLICQYQDTGKRERVRQNNIKPITSHGYGSAALRAELDAVRNAVEGNRNATLNRAAFALGQLIAGGELLRSDVEPVLLSAAMSTGLAEREIIATMRSAFNAGAADPRNAPLN